MRILYSFEFAGLLSLLGTLAACGSHSKLQCEQSSSCDLATGGVCSDPGTGNRWCAYPDGSCPSGYRYSDVQVGDGIAGMCVTTADAGVDGPPISSDGNSSGGDNTCKPRVVFVDGQPPFSNGDDGSGRRHVWVANPDGTEMLELSRNAGTDSAHPSWSPDGLKIAFASNPTGKYDIFVVNVNGDGLTNLTSGSDFPFDASNPVWSPDGTRIAFSTVGHPWIMNANGTGATSISTKLLGGAIMAWSPGGTQLVVSGSDPTVANSGGLYVFTIGSTGEAVKITSGTASAFSPSWAPSAKIIFDNSGDVFAVNGDGSSLFNVTNNPSAANSRALFVKGRNALVFSSRRDNGYSELWQIPDTGGSPTQLTNNTIAHGGDFADAVTLEPDGGLLAFHRITQTVQPDNTTVVTVYQLGISRLDGSDVHFFNAPGGANATEARFASCR